jgi:hypothetical protein
LYSISSTEAIPSATVASDQVSERFCVEDSYEAYSSAGQHETKVTHGVSAHSKAKRVEVSFEGGTVCHAGSTQDSVHYSCDERVFGLAVDSGAEPDVCHYLISARSYVACGRGKTAAVGVSWFHAKHLYNTIGI